MLLNNVFKRLLGVLLVFCLVVGLVVFLVPVVAAAGAAQQMIAAGDGYSLALKGDGTVWAWRYNGNGQLGSSAATDHYTSVQVSALVGVSAIVAGNSHSLALKGDGTVWAWGSNGFGQLGDDTATDHSSAPVQVKGLADASAIAVGVWHSLVLKSDGTVWAWGYNGDGKLGDGIAD